MRRLIRSICLTVLIVAATGLFAQSGADDPVLKAMQAEMERSKTKLQLDQQKKPYYIEYAITDQDEYAADAVFGALQTDLRSRARILRVLVRVGDYKQDDVVAQNESAVQLAPFENDVPAIRLAIWLATDAAYKRALEQFTEKQAALKQFENSDPQPDDFAHAPVVNNIGALAKMQLDTATWKKNLETVSAMYRTDPKLDSFAVVLRATVTNKYFLNSEGSTTRNGSVTYLYNIEGSTQAPDGMRLDRSAGKVVAAPAELPTLDGLKDDAKTLMGTLAALREAPIVEEQYRGPVLIAPDAASDLLKSLVGDNVLGRRPQPGDNARVMGPFANEFKSRVLPDFVTVVDDPTKVSLGGHTLLGHYDVDDEAVKATPVTVISQGKLVSYLTDRTPVRDFPSSNGHGRSSPVTSARPGIANFFVTSSEPLDKDKLKAKFIELCKAHDQKYCYRVETLSPRLAPRLLYRVYVSDGHEELVRGARFDQLDTRAIRSDLVALGNDEEAFNTITPSPASIVVPSMLFDELDIKRANAAKEKLPDYPPPDLKGN
jgi:predicted Zn-dependent protease